MHWAVAPHLPSCLFIPVEMQWVGHTVVVCVQKSAMQQEASWHQPAIELYKCLSPVSVFLAHFSTDYAEVEICFDLAGHLYVLLITAPLMQYICATSSGVDCVALVGTYLQVRDFAGRTPFS